MIALSERASGTTEVFCNNSEYQSDREISEYICRIRMSRRLESGRPRLELLSIITSPGKLPDFSELNHFFTFKT